MKDDISGWNTWYKAFSDIAEFNSPSELHGLLTGIVCVLEAPSETQWESILAQLDVSLESDAIQLLTEEAEDVAGLLAEEDMDFMPLLPDDNHTLAERVQSLCDWCEGILLGFGLAGGIVRNDERELINDLGFIAALTFDEEDEEDSEQGEKGYAELVEFARLIPCSLSMGRKKQLVKHAEMLNTPMGHRSKEAKPAMIVESFNPNRPS